MKKTENNTGRRQILIVDDEEFIRDLLTEIIVPMGFEVFTASDGPQAVDIFRQHEGNIELALLDVILPGMDGKDVYYKLKSIRPDVNIIILSGYSQTKIRQELLEAGVEGYITKPFEINQVKKLISTVLSAK